MEIDTDYGTLEATIPDNQKGVGVAISGGMDSATLLYMLCKQIRDRQLDIPVYCYIVAYDYDRGSLYNGGLVIKHMRKEFPDVKIHAQMFVTAEAIGNMKAQFAGAMFHETLRKNKWTGTEFRLWFGLTSNPQDDSFKFETPKEWYVTPDSARQPGNIDLKAKPRYGIGACHPFVLVDKRVIVQAVWMMGLWYCFDTITNSCTNIKQYDCGGCWWCQERAWATKISVPEEDWPRQGVQKLIHYSTQKNISKLWRDGVVWTKEGYEARQKFEEENPQFFKTFGQRIS